MIKSKRFIYWALMCTFMAIITIVCGITITESAKVATLTLDQTVTYNAPTNIPVTLDANGGSFGGSTSREVIIKLCDVLGSSDILSNLPTRAGYTLSGWKYSKDNITFYTYDSNTEFPFTDHLYLQAQWTISTYTVTMLRNNDNYGTLSPSSSLTIGYGASITVSGNQITFGATDGNVATTITATPSSATGYTTTFTSWDNVSGTITANRSITATFTRTANTYSITYAGMDGAEHGTDHPTSATYGTPFTVSNPSKAGYSFTGWEISNMDTVSHTYGEDSSNSQTLSAVTATTFNNLRSTSGTVTFTATWQEAVGNYTVTFTGDMFLYDPSFMYQVGSTIVNPPGETGNPSGWTELYDKSSGYTVSVQAGQKIFFTMMSATFPMMGDIYYFDFYIGNSYQRITTTKSSAMSGKRTLTASGYYYIEFEINGDVTIDCQFTCVG